MGAREAILAAAANANGWTAPDDNFLNLVDPGQPAEHQQEVAKDESCCGLVVLGIQEAALEVPARGTGDAFTVVYRRVGGNPWKPGGAMRLATQDAPPQAGDAVVYGQAGNAVAHMETVACADLADDTLTLTCIAGGERKEGLQTVATMTRVLKFVRGHWTDQQNQRPIIGVIDADLLGGMFPVLGA